jgi:tRNA threonylcarbamoyladenosine biosynthesis protein TsaB
MILGIDCSDDFVSAGLASDSRVVISRSSGAEVRKNIIHRFVEQLLNDKGLSLDQIEGIAVGIGPGSFTGLRVGLAAAKGICWANQLPLAGVSTLLAVAGCTESGDGNILAVKDAKRNEFYFGGFARKNESLEQVIPDSLGTMEDVVRLLDGGFRATGPGVAVLKRRGLKLPKDGEISYCYEAVGGEIARLGERMISVGDIIDIAEGAPHYIRIPGYIGGCI